MSLRTKSAALLPPKVIAEHLSMSIDFIYTEIQSENLHAIKVGREWRVSTDEAVRYLGTLQAPVPVEWMGR